MSEDYCRGCGIAIQTTEPSKPGYIPEVVAQKDQLVCQRCYRITHYGEIGLVHPEPGKIRQKISKAISLSNLLVIVVDFADLTGSLPVWTGLLAGKPYVLIINKSDLLPLRTKQSEILEYITLYLKKWDWASPQDIILASGLKGYGIDILGRRLKKEADAGAKIAILGTTNVGKSSIIKRLLSLESSPKAPTISKFPGTTMGLSNWSIFKGRNTLIDTPGLVPDSRIGDLFCPECATALVSTTKIEQKLWGLKPGKGLIIGGLFGLENLSPEETVIIVFTSPELILHRTDNTKIKGLLDEHPVWLNKICQNCQQKLQWHEETIRLVANQDIAIAGLGWLSLRTASADFKIWVPQGIQWEIRQALVGKR